MQLLWMALFTAGAVALDQWIKFLVVENIPLFTQMEVIPGLFHLTYVQNTGAAFSLFEGAQWLFALVFIVFTVLLVWEHFKKFIRFNTLERWCIAAIYAGGLGNMIDRIRLGYVVDMIAVDFIRFPVFNIADCFITCGCAVLVASLLLFNKEFWKDDKS